mmetsp:Transcript_12507/g.17073  ORF Transcript_12507/g.17073 Transcript_12507/m.17073 type:complete len:220 (-) Transcript_12507:3949-4608(-)
MGEEVAEAVLPPCVPKVLLCQHIGLHLLCLHLVQDQPRRHVRKHLGQLLAEGTLLRGHAGTLGHLRLDQVPDFGDDAELQSLPGADASHAERTLGVVTERHVLAQSEQGTGRVVLLDVHSRGVDLIVKGEALVLGHSTLAELDDLHPLPHQNHLGVGVVQEHHRLHRGQPGRKQVLGHLEVGHTCDERSSVDESVNGRICGGNRVEQTLYRPIIGCHLV